MFAPNWLEHSPEKKARRITIILISIFILVIASIVGVLIFLAQKGRFAIDPQQITESFNSSTLRSIVFFVEKYLKYNLSKNQTFHRLFVFKGLSKESRLFVDAGEEFSDEIVLKLKAGVYRAMMNHQKVQLPKHYGLP